MSISIKNNKAQILLLSVALTFIIFFLNKNSSGSLPAFPFNLRNLITKDDVDKRCENAPKDFLSKYNTTEVPPVRETENLTEYQEILKKIIEEEKFEFSDFKKYIPRMFIYFLFLIIDVLFLIIWFIFCGCCCCCGTKNKSSAGGCAKLLFFLFCFFSVISIIICVIGFFYSPTIEKSMNGVICSLYKLVFHFTDGTNQEIQNSDWKGFEGINLLIEEYTSTQQKINNLKKSSDIEYCTNNNQPQICEDYKEIFDKLQKENNTAFISILEDSKKNINSISKTFIDIKSKTFDDIEKIMQKIDDYYLIAMIILFAAIAALSLLGLFTLSPYFCCNCSYLGCLYHIFWNLEMLVIIITLLVGSIVGTVGILSKDSVSLLNYAKSHENLSNGKPFIFKDYNEKIDICFNGNGYLSYDFNGLVYNSSISSYSGDFKTNYNNYQKEQIFNQEKELAKAFQDLNVIIDNLVDLNDNLKEGKLLKIFNCQFIRIDTDILLNEINDCLAKKLILFSLVIIISDLAAFVSIFFGLLFKINYKGQGDFEEVKGHEKNLGSHSRVPINKINPDNSKDNFNMK